MTRGKIVYILFTCWFTFFWIISLRAVFFTLAPVISGELGLMPGQAGLLLGTLFFGHSVAVWLSNFIPIGRRMIVTGGILLTIAGLFGLTAVSTFELLLSVTFIISFGGGLYLPRGLSLISDISNAGNRGRMIGIHEQAPIIGIVLGPLFVYVMLPHLDWEYIILTWGIIGIFAILFFLRIPDRLAAGNAPGRRGKSGCKFDAGFICYSIAGTSQFMMMMGLVSVLPLLLVNAWGKEPSFAASYVGLTRLTGVIGLPIAGAVSDRFGRLNILLSQMGIVFVCLPLMAVCGYGDVFTLAWVLMTFAVSGAPTVLFSSISEYYPEVKDKMLGAISGISSLLGLVAAPAAFAYLIGRYPPHVIFFSAAVIVLLGWVAVLYLYVSKKRVSSLSKKEAKSVYAAH